MRNLDFNRRKFWIPERDFGWESDQYSPDIDVIDSEDELILKVDLPGVEKEDIKLNISKDTAEVKAEREEKFEEGEENYCVAERNYSKFYRKISLPEEIIPGKASARFINGVLEIRAPKSEAGEENRKEI